MTTLPENKILWRKGVISSIRNKHGQIVLSFADGTTATGFRLVVGADGIRSKIRHLVCNVLQVIAAILRSNGSRLFCEVFSAKPISHQI